MCHDNDCSPTYCRYAFCAFLAGSFQTKKKTKRILDIFRTFRKHLDRAKAMGIDERAVIDSLRPDTQTLWLGIPTDEKRRFLRHLFRYWEIIRSRLPPESEAIIATMRDSGQFNVIAGQIHDFAEAGEALEVHYTHFTRILIAALLPWKLHPPGYSHFRHHENLCCPSRQSCGFGSWRRFWRHRH
jgi:uncharacterized NAD(P)/FAD-binding protein YdhS